MENSCDFEMGGFKGLTILGMTECWWWLGSSHRRQLPKRLMTSATMTARDPMVVSTSKASNTYTAFARNRSGNGQLYLSEQVNSRPALPILLYERSSLQPRFFCQAREAIQWGNYDALSRPRYICDQPQPSTRCLVLQGNCCQSPPEVA